VPTAEEVSRPGTKRLTPKHEYEGYEKFRFLATMSSERFGGRHDASSN
jgi:hypothetical protein